MAEEKEEKLIFKVDLHKLKGVDLTPTQYCYLLCKASGKKFPWDVPDVQVEFLLTNKWLLKKDNNLVISAKFIIFANLEIEKQKVEDWIDEWRDLFPKGVKSGGRLVRGDKQGCLKRMRLFLKQYPYTKDQIIQATKDYLFEKERDNYRFMICADYLISKNGISQLASIIENNEERGSLLDNISKEAGNTSFHKEV